MRNASLLSVGGCIAQRQAQALAGGGLAVLTRRMVSHEAGLHETTVGRIVRYGAARVGGRVINLRDLLCRQGAADKTSSAISRTAVVQVMEDLRQAAGQPRSDSRKSALLAERGVHLARRTISKYRACRLMSNRQAQHAGSAAPRKLQKSGIGQRHEGPRPAFPRERMRLLKGNVLGKMNEQITDPPRLTDARKTCSCAPLLRAFTQRKAASVH